VADPDRREDLRLLDATLDRLVEAFNGAADQVRIVALLSPT